MIAWVRDIQIVLGINLCLTKYWEIALPPTHPIKLQKEKRETARSYQCQCVEHNLPMPSCQGQSPQNQPLRSRLSKEAKSQLGHHFLQLEILPSMQSPCLLPHRTLPNSQKGICIRLRIVFFNTCLSILWGPPWYCVKFEAATVLWLTPQVSWHLEKLSFLWGSLEKPSWT